LFKKFLDTYLKCYQKIFKEILYSQRFLRHNQNGLSKKYYPIYKRPKRESLKGTAGALLPAMLLAGRV
jgi:hypothetical protein